MSRQPTQISNRVQQIYRDLVNELHEIEKTAHNVSLSVANNAISVDAHTNDSDEEMETSYELDLLATLDKELHQLCGRLACIIDTIGPVFPRSKDHAIQSYFLKLTEEIENMKLTNKKNGQQEKGFRNRIRLLQLQKNSLEKAVIGAQSRLATDEEESSRAAKLLKRVYEEFNGTRKDLHYVLSKLFPEDGEQMKNLLAALTEAHDSKDPQNWIDISPYVTSHVELLLRDMIIELNPTDDRMARFTI